VLEGDFCVGDGSRATSDSLMGFRGRAGLRNRSSDKTLRLLGTRLREFLPNLAGMDSGAESSEWSQELDEASRHGRPLSRPAYELGPSP